MKTLRTLIRLDAVLLAYFGLLMATSTYSVTVKRPGGVYRFDQEQAPLIFLGTSVVVLAVVLFVVSDFALIGHRRKLGNLLAAGNLVIAVTVIVAQPSYWGSVIGWIPALVLLIMAIALAWASRRPPGSGDPAAELAALQIPDDVRKALLRQIGEAAAQEERNRLARDLHDSIKQQLFTINVSTAAAQELWERDPEKARGALEDVRRSAKEAMVEMQALLHQLTPRALASAGLVEAIREQCEALGYRTGAKVTLELGEPIPDDRLPPGAQETLFRIAQEALSNVARHARAREVRARLSQEGDFAMLQVMDDGRGFQLEQVPSGMGLRNLRERADSLRGNLAVTSSPGSGTTIEVRIPLNPLRLPKTAVEKAIRREEILFGSLSLTALAFVLGAHFYYFQAAFILFLLVLPVTSWRSAQRAVKTSPSAPPGFMPMLLYNLQRSRAACFLLAAWWAPWHWRLEEEGWTNGRYIWLAFAVICSLLFVREIVSIHKSTQFGTVGQIVPSVSFSLALFTALGVILIGAMPVVYFAGYSTYMDPKDVEIITEGLVGIFSPFPIKVLFFATVAPVLLYLFSRLPRIEGASA